MGVDVQDWALFDSDGEEDALDVVDAVGLGGERDGSDGKSAGENSGGRAMLHAGIPGGVCGCDRGRPVCCDQTVRPYGFRGLFRVI